MDTFLRRSCADIDLDNLFDIARTSTVLVVQEALSTLICWTRIAHGEEISRLTDIDVRNGFDFDQLPEPDDRDITGACFEANQ